MNKKLHVGTSPLTNRIYAGHVLIKGVWSSNKQDVTTAAIGAVCEHVVANGKPIVVSCNGKPAFRVTVEKLEGAPV